MKINKKQEKEVIQVYDTWLQSYLNGDVKTYDFYLDDEYRFVGSTGNEEFLNRADTTKFFAKTADQLAGKTNLKNTVRTIELIDGIAFVTELFDAYFLIDSDWKFYGRFRFTSALSKKKAGWRFIYQHFSMPDSKAQEGETLGAEQISKENQQLRDAIKRRTVELEQKNRELEIESSLERVRTRAMAMQNSNELSALVDTVFQELTKLDFSLTACIINIIDGDDKSNTVWVTNPETGKDPESYYLKFEDYKFHHGMWKAWKARKNRWVYTIEGAEKETYQNYLFNETEFKRFSKNAKEGFLALEKWVASFTFSNFGGLQTVGEEPLSNENLDILARFGKVFDLTYTRFNDLKQAEAQAREAQVELALERVRARTMAMHNSVELGDVATVLFKELNKLVENLWTCGFVLCEKDRAEDEWWLSDKGGFIPALFLPNTGDVTHANIYNAWKKGATYHTEQLEGKALQKHYDWLMNIPVAKKYFEDSMEVGFEMPTWQKLHCAFFKTGYLVIITQVPCPEEDIFKRFAQVFDQTYTRFLDLKKAEAQAKEIEIELSLERVRSKAMTMTKSSDLLDIVVTMRSEFIKLGHDAHYFWHMAWLPTTYQKAMTSGDGTRIGNVMELPRDFHQNKAMMAWEKSDQPVAVFALETESAVDYIDKMVTLGDFQKIDHNAPTLDDIRHIGGLTFIMARTTHGEIGYSLPGVVKNPPAEDLDILVRFAVTFDLAHKRFEDLRVSEHQARETQIELSLERVRSRSMAMHQTSELQEVIHVVYQEFKKLQIAITGGVFIAINNEIKEEINCWGSGGTTEYIERVHLPFLNIPIYTGLIKNIQKGPGFFTEEFSNQEKKKFFKHLFKQPEYSKTSDVHKKEITQREGGYTRSCAISKNTSIFIVNHHGVKFSKEDNEILIRFGRVFEQTYTRFLDLQKAEEQAREAKIEAALERVRSRSMAMHTSEELKEVIQLVYDQFVHLNIQIEHTGFIIDYKARDDMHIWLADKQKIPSQVTIPYFDSPHWNSFIDAKKEGIDFFINKLTFAEKNKFYKKLFKFIPDLPEEAKKFYLTCPGLAASTVLLDNIGLYIENFSGIPYTDEENNMLMRFGKVFQQTYTRFLDLQKAEAQAREAQIEHALEKVRSRTMAMQNSSELPEAANNLFLQVQALGIPAWSAGYCIWENEQKSAWCNMSSEGEIQKGFSLPTIGEGYDFYNPLKNGEPFYVDELGGKELVKHYDFMIKLPVVGEILEEFEEKGIPLPTFQIFHIVYFTHGYLMFITYEAVPNDWDVFKRFGKVFQQTYTRFLDLKKAEEQAREAQIEVALERVRARALAMHSSDELVEVSLVLREQMAVIGQDQLETIAIHFIPDDEAKFSAWFAFHPPEIEEQEIKFGTVDFSKTDTYYARQFIRLYNSNEANYLIKARGNHLKEWQDMLMKNVPVFKELWVDDIPMDQYWYFSDFSGGNLMLITLDKASEEALELLRRSAQVFDLAYRRYLDLQKAETQAREAKIEVALERVRASSMAMHKSEELLNVIKVISQQLVALKFRFDNVSFGQNNQEHDYNFWVSINGHPDPVQIHVPYLDTPVLASLIEAYKNDVSFLMNTFTLEENKVWSQHMAKHVDFSFLNKAERTHIQNSSFTRSSAILPNIQLFVGKYEATPYTDEENNIIIRFAQVFDQSYTRFLDLQKAEEQAREAQIEASLERVRSKTMAMHNSKDVGETVVTLFNEVLKLGLDKSIRCGIGILEGNEGMQTWSANILPNGEINLRMGMLDMTIHPLLIGLKKEWKKGETGYTYELIGNDVTRYYKALNKDPEYPFNADLDTLPEKVFHNSFFFSEGILFAFASNPISEEAAKVLKRFTSVFEQTYTRFLDLQKAEEQTKEAQIEASLERVRSKAMAMHNSEDLVTTANQLFKEFQYLDISFIRCGVLKIEESRKTEVYAYSLTKDKKAVAVYGEFNLSGHEMLDEVFEHWQLQKEYTNEMKGDAVKRYYQLLNKQVDIPKIELGKSHFVYGFYFTEGCLYCFTNEKLTDDTLRILRKFNAVMGLTYRRYFELQESEARELAAIKESSLDRVRAEIASMRTADDLNRITPIVWKELNSLGVPFFRCGVFIVDNQSERVHAYLSSPSGESIAALELEFDSLPLVKGVVSNWKKQKIYIEKWNKAQFIEFTQPLIDQGQINSSKKYQGGLEPPDKLVLQMVPFKQGMLYVGSENPLSNDHISMVESLAKAFSVAYTRYEDFKELEAAKGRAEDTLMELKSTQTQLIQSEKMASLGELTAGIAHEIQNPLNFVNNFSEISEEMLEELEEEIKDNSDKIVKEIMTDLKQNLNKINHHGKRASSIVKGMLDHSRTSSGNKELTDINALADEFLRLSYHGLRAKDKTFNAAFKSDLDKTIPKIEIVSQDIGRVILNLINNAFYAVNKKDKEENKDYKPMVILATKKVKNTIEITVKDNGTGISKENANKIFQPFFTTKPTGEGTGLGLSLAYDIITKGHNGELKVESKEGEFTQFTIVLPIKN